MRERELKLENFKRERERIKGQERAIVTSTLRERERERVTFKELACVLFYKAINNL